MTEIERRESFESFRSVATSGETLPADYDDAVAR